MCDARLTRAIIISLNVQSSDGDFVDGVIIGLSLSLPVYFDQHGAATFLRTKLNGHRISIGRTLDSITSETHRQTMRDGHRSPFRVLLLLLYWYSIGDVQPITRDHLSLFLLDESPSYRFLFFSLYPMICAYTTRCDAKTFILNSFFEGFHGRDVNEPFPVPPLARHLRRRIGFIRPFVSLKASNVFLIGRH